jgi:hypothetical protein
MDCRECARAMGIIRRSRMNADGSTGDDAAARTTVARG